MKKDIVWKEPKNEVKNSGAILACWCYHKMFPDGRDACSNNGIEEVDGKKWEIFNVYSETEEAYYGTPLEGLGLFDCMLLKSDTRPFTDRELDFWSDQQMGMYGSYSGKLSYGFKVSLKQCESLVGDKSNDD